MIYLDMDGVIADFFGAIANRFGVDHWKTIQDREIAFASLANTNFFDTIPCFFDRETNLSAHIVEHVKHFAFDNEIGWGICSSPMRGDTNNSAYWKRIWLERMNFAPPLVENMVFTSNKHKYATSRLDYRPNILIDDKPENIHRWEQAGGIGIRFQCNEDDTEEYLFPALEEAILCR
jgi:hypothetical protein